jgi:cyclohexanone monooxygenase
MWPQIQLNTEIVAADYQKEQGIWKVTTASGDTYTCKYFISSMGMISHPVIPDIKGKECFKGPIFHSSRWPEGLEYKGKRVGIIGAGATTVQMVPAMAEEAAEVTVFHRTANYILPAMQRPMTEEWSQARKEMLW